MAMDYGVKFCTKNPFTLNAIKAKFWDKRAEYTFKYKIAL